MPDSEREKWRWARAVEPVNANTESRRDRGGIFLKLVGAMSSVPRDGNAARGRVGNGVEKMSHDAVRHPDHQASVHAALAGTEHSTNSGRAERPAIGFSWDGIILAGYVVSTFNDFTVDGLVVGGLNGLGVETRYNNLTYIYHNRCMAFKAGKRLSHFQPMGSTWWESM